MCGSSAFTGVKPKHHKSMLRNTEYMH